MRNRILPPVLAILLGFTAALMRLWQRSASLGGLPRAGHLSTALLLALCAVAALYFLTAVLRLKPEAPAAAPPPLSPAQRILFFLSALMTAFSLLSYLKQVMSSLLSRQGVGPVLLECILSLAAILALLSLLYPALIPLRTAKGDSYAALFPAVYGWMWLIDVYRKHTANPVLWDHVFLLLAAIALLMAAFWRAGFSFGQGRPRLTAYAALCGLFLVPIALAGDHDTPSLCIALSLGLYALTVLLWPPVPPDVPAEKTDDEPAPETAPTPQEIEIETEEPSDE